MSHGDKNRSLVRFVPEWGPRSPLGALPVSAHLHDRAKRWNYVWQTALDPHRELGWDDASAGWAWVREGRAIVIAVQEELGASYLVVGDFDMYAPRGVD